MAEGSAPVSRSSAVASATSSAAPNPRLAVIKLPRTASRRGAICFVQVLTSVEARPVSGFGFEGPRYASGYRLSLADLMGEREADPIAFECTEIEGTFGERARRKWDALYILWRYRRDRNEWEEIARVSGDRSAMASELRPIAHRALLQRGWGIVPTAQEGADRIREALDRELAKIEELQRPAVIAILHDLVCSWMVGEQQWGFIP